MSKNEIIAEIMRLSSGTLASVTGEANYQKQDDVVAAWVTAVGATTEVFASWQESWIWFKGQQP